MTAESVLLSTDTGTRTPTHRLRIWRTSLIRYRLVFVAGHSGRASNPQAFRHRLERPATLPTSSTRARFTTEQRARESNPMPCGTITFPKCAHHRSGLTLYVRPARISGSAVITTVLMKAISFMWRRARDLNPRGPSDP